MAAIVVSRVVFPAASELAIGAAEKGTRARTHPKMVLTCGTIKLALPYAPRGGSIGGYGAVWQEIPRPGRIPLLLRNGLKLRTQSWDLFFGTQDRNQSVQAAIDSLTAMAASYTPISITMGPGATLRWHITEMTLEITQKAQQTNAPTRATASITITQSSELAPAPGPVKGGVKSPVPAKPAPAKKPAVKAPAKPAARVHVVKKGEWLSTISNIYYKTPSKWKVIADANGIKNANKIFPGQRLRIP